MRPLAPGDTETVRLIKQVRALGNARWARDYLAAARFLIDRLGLDPDDRRVNTSLPRRSAKWLLPITINHRYVLVAVRMGDERVAAAMCLPSSTRFPTSGVWPRAHGALMPSAAKGRSIRHGSSGFAIHGFSSKTTTCGKAGSMRPGASSSGRQRRLIAATTRIRPFNS